MWRPPAAGAALIPASEWEPAGARPGRYHDVYPSQSYASESQACHMFKFLRLRAAGAAKAGQD